MYKNSLCIIGSTGTGKSSFLKELYEETLSQLPEKVFVYEEFPIINLEQNATSLTKSEMEKFLKDIKKITTPTIIILDTAREFKNELILSAFENQKIFTLLTYYFETKLNTDVISKCENIEKLSMRFLHEKV